MSDQPTFDGMPVKLFSCTPSRLDTWLDCPRKYRYTYIDTPRPPRGGPWAHASMGAAVHNVLREWWTKPLDERTTQVGEVLLTKFWRTDGFKDDEQAERSFVRAKAWITNYLKTVDINDEPRGLERTVSATTETLSISGRVDRIDERDGELVIVDYKTGRNAPEVDDVASSLALAIYAVGAARTMRMKCTKVELHHLPSETVVAYDHSPESLNRHIKRAESIAREVQAEALKPESESNYRPNPSVLCGYCDFARICPDASVEPAKPWAVIEKQEL